MGTGTSKLQSKQRCYNQAVEVIERARAMSEQNRINSSPPPPYVENEIDDINTVQDTYNHEVRVAEVIDNALGNPMLLFRDPRIVDRLDSLHYRKYGIHLKDYSTIIYRKRGQTEEETGPWIHAKVLDDKLYFPKDTGYVNTVYHVTLTNKGDIDFSVTKGMKNGTYGKYEIVVDTCKSN